MENQSKCISPRISWVDAAKGLAIFCIVYGHASRNEGLLARMVYTFHVPMCVLITGYLYKVRQEHLWDHLRKTGYRLLLPYFVWSLISIGIYMVMGRLAASSFEAEFYTLKENLQFMLLGRSIGNAALWYLPFLFLCYLMMDLWVRLLRNLHLHSKASRLSIAALPVILSVMLLAVYTRYQYVYNLDLPFGINNALFLFPFFWLGYLGSQRKPLPDGKIWLLPALLLTAGSIYAGIRFNEPVEYMRLTESDYGSNVFVFYASAIVSAVCLCWICKILKRNRLLQWFGRNAMAILVMHKFPVLFFQVVLGDMGERFGNFRFLWYLLISLLSMSMCCAVGAFLHRYLPWTIGEHKK